ncbi:iron-containing alcohol dehydrogenase family protein [Domibacillus aminovorans]|uniref:Uncharacterized protein n=1 Tax=Domibacillus aminovorans TaxID=29332 RepID=A0A177KZY6_9BACI|nr:iron-containing alcohol dehydrogenase family protein [Domibacillus aminovorans]OAH58999.1 hypothetical protein AWH49_04870 [Domibacillus aminovorans]
MSLQNQTFFSTLPTEVKFGMHITQKELAKDIRATGNQKVFIATDKGLLEAGVVDEVTTVLEKEGLDYVMFSDIEPNPYAETIMKGLAAYQENGCDMILAVGGGSAIDFGKAVGVMVNNPGHILDYRRGKKTVTKPLPALFVISTTVGTGSEVTAVSVVTDPTVSRKYIVASPYLLPKTAYIDPTLTLNLPRQHVAATGIDALVHAMEAYTSMNSTPIADGLALQAVRMIKEYLPHTYAHPDDYEARSQVHLASTMAGMAFGLAGLGLVHSCSHPMSAVYHVPHGVANAIILPYVIEYNVISNYKKYADLACIFDEQLVMERKEKAADQLAALIKKFTASVDIPEDFSFLGIDVDEDVIDRLANDAMDDKGTIPVNPRKVYKEDVVNIYKRVLPMTKKEAYS